MGERPRGYSDEEWTALQRGARIVRGRMYEDAAPLHQIRYPNGAVRNLDLTSTISVRRTGTGEPVDAEITVEPAGPALIYNEYWRPARWWKRALRRLIRRSADV